MSAVALVTGGAQGIGWATARRLVRDIAHMVVIDLDGAAAEARAEELGSGHLGVGADVTDAAQVRALVGRVMADFGRIDVLVNNAGIADQPGETLVQSGEAFERVLRVNLCGTFLVTQAVAGEMLARRQGAIVNLSSIAGLGGIPTRNAYSAAKAGILGMTRSMACEWARQGVRVNAIAPGYVRTSLVEELEERGTIDTAALEARIPMGRLADPTEIAEAIAFLTSPQASFITGSVLVADGGWSALGAPEVSLQP
ncbi:glucose 1-dehydrogenase [Halomonas daqingensis]|uniref:Glucose 1-dehydrogenase n=1 Tax=Billgrantia desiderata TaxID=52021 RepID=A0ABS9B8H9_9GAMM|nr:glucose 1-dehydrogenase [Halomonas desiderata]MCE8043968.1 glucose 1-dehydrogenase [Halomonas desiderata]MCE8048542.1 glucose 1-dehydrogenase [Halomonas desiderata]